MQAKLDAELGFWIGMIGELTEGRKEKSERDAALLAVCHERAFPRYRRDLYLNERSFSGQRILDLGCGPHCGVIGFRDAEKHGADHLISEYKRIGYPLDAHGVRYCAAKSEYLPYPDSCFDCVLCVNAIDHVDDLVQTLREVSRVLKSHGRLIGQFNFHKHPTPTEPICLTHTSLAAALSSTGLEVDKVIYQYTLDDGHEDRYYYEVHKSRRWVSRSDFEARFAAAEARPS